MNDGRILEDMKTNWQPYCGNSWLNLNIKWRCKVEEFWKTLERNWQPCSAMRCHILGWLQIGCSFGWDTDHFEGQLHSLTVEDYWLSDFSSSVQKTRSITFHQNYSKGPPCSKMQDGGWGGRAWYTGYLERDSFPLYKFFGCDRKFHISIIYWLHVVWKGLIEWGSEMIWNIQICSIQNDQYFLSEAKHAFNTWQLLWF